MKTLVYPAEQPNTPQEAARIIQRGDLVAIPTETVYGLGADGLNPDAVAKIFAAKGRPQDNPLILHVTGMEQVETLCHPIPAAAYRLAEAFWPGPLTMVLPARECVPKCTTAGLPTVAVRCPDNAVTREIIALSGVPIAAPSANISGKPSTTTADHVLHDHHGKIPMIVDGGPCRVGVESTIVDLTETPPRLLRPGGITPEQLTEILGDLVVDKAVTAQIDQDAVVKAPGMKYRHYAPQCQVVIVAGNRQQAARYIQRQYRPGDHVLCFEEELPLYEGCNPLSYGKEADLETLSAGLFAALRKLDDPSVQKVYARCPEGGGIAYAIQNRLKKAAAFQVIHPEDSLVIGITGGTGCGKTAALDVIREMGGVVLDCDAIYHDLLQTDKALLDAIETRFPGTVENGQLQRKKLGNIVFHDEVALADLNHITHIAITQEVKKQLQSSGKLAAIDAIRLFESGLHALCDVTVAITAPEAVRIRRLMSRDNITEEYARARISAQPPQSTYVQRCDHCLENSGSLAEFREKCLAFLHGLGIIKEKQ